MSNSFNQVILIGHLGRNPEIVCTGKHPFARLSVATSRTWKKEGKKQERVDWHTVLLFRPEAVEYAEKHLTTGDKIQIAGELHAPLINGRRHVIVNAQKLIFLSRKHEQIPVVEPAAGEDLNADNKDDLGDYVDGYTEHSLISIAGA